MAVYTQVDRPALIQFLRSYTIGDLKAFQPIAAGVENSNYLLQTSKDRYILTLFEQRTPESDLPFFLELKRHLHRKGIACPLPIEQKSGECLGRLCGRPATIVSFLEGQSISDTTEDHCRQVGHTLARLHLAAGDFNGQRTNGLGLQAWRPLFEKSRRRAHEVEPELAEELSRELDYLETHWPADLPTGIAHADLFRDNVFFIDNQLSGLIDFYFSCNEQLAYDLAITLNAWCFEKTASHFQVVPERWQAMVSGYQSIRPLTCEEEKQLPLLCRGAAIRFLLTRLYDWLNVPEGALTIPHDPQEYLDKLRFHRES